MSDHHHVRDVCRCGAVQAQCKCPAPKVARVVCETCPRCASAPGARVPNTSEARLLAVVLETPANVEAVAKTLYNNVRSESRPFWPPWESAPAQLRAGAEKDAKAILADLRKRAGVAEA